VRVGVYQLLTLHLGYTNPIMLYKAKFAVRSEIREKQTKLMWAPWRFSKL